MKERKNKRKNMSENANGNTRVIRNDNDGYAIIEKVNNEGIVTFRRIRRPNGSFSCEYFDGTGIDANTIFIYRKGSYMVEDRYSDEDGKRLSSLSYPLPEFWEERIR